MRNRARSKLTRWYDSDSDAARRVRRAYRRLYFALFGYERIFYVYDDRKLVYIETPKAGCTSIKATIGRYYGIKQGDNQAGEPSRWHEERGKLPAHLSGYYKFSFVRNPYSRLVSCYVDKLYRWRRLDDVFAASSFCHLPTRTSFPGFVRAIARIPDYWANPHFKSQYSILYRRGRPLTDWVGHLESIDRDWGELAARFDLIRAVEFHKSSHNLGPFDDYRSYYTPELARLVRQRYRRDFEVFGYSAALGALDGKESS
ncbi:MAG: sulfotransferase family 2 domain-containing protein [Anaerolineales bacterium]|nr:sulfotransferase family 2 domain-containing protein [Anaerolineales bacterium]